MLRRLVFLVPILFWAGCDDAADPSPPGGPVIGMTDPCVGDAPRCDGDRVQVCTAGVWVDDVICAADQLCVAGVCTGAECVADCAGRSCGDDGCGATCGACADGESCNADGECVPPAACGDAVCDGDETCSTCAVDCGNCCGDGVCGADETCVSCVSDCGCTDPEICDADRAACVACTPQCDGRECGDDGCGGVCGACGDAACVDGLCDVGCVPRCDGRACGDDGCQGSCGACDGGDICDADGVCVAPPADCGDGQCGAGEDCSTCAEDCGACCGDGRCAAAENCTACAADCACPDGERCADDRRACVPVCVPQCDGRNCGGDGCGGDCGECANAQACEAGVCVDVCQPDCTDRACGGDGCQGSCGDCADGSACDAGVCEAVCQPQCMGLECGDNGCGGTCGECAGDATCQADGACRVPLLIDAPGVYPREGQRVEGRLVVAERSVVTLRLSGPDGACQVLNRIILYTPDDALVGSARDTEDTPCATFSMALNAGEYKLFVDYFGLNAAYTITAEFAPIADTIDAPGVYARLPEAGEDALTIRIAEPVVLAAVPGGPNLRACPFSATLELTQDGQLVGNGVSRRGGSGCGRVLVHLQPGEYRLQFFSDEPARPVERYALHVAMTPIGPDVLNDDAIIGRPGAAAGDPDTITLNIAGPSILRFRIEDGLGQCVTYRYGLDRPDIFNDGSCVEHARQFPHPGGELTLFFDAQAGLLPYVLALDIEPIPTGDAFLPRSSILRPDTDGDYVFVFVEVPSQVDFALEGPGAPCDSGISRTQYDGYRRINYSVADGPCAWSALLDPGLHGFTYVAAEQPRGVPLDRRITVTPLNTELAGPGVYGRPRTQGLESLPFVLDAPQVVRITPRRGAAQGCFPYDFAVILEDGRRVEPQDERCWQLTSLMPAGAHRFEWEGEAVDFHFEFAEAFEGDGSMARPATDALGEMLHLIGPPEGVLYLSQYVDGVCPQRGPYPLITDFDGLTRTINCSLQAVPGLNGHAMLSQPGAIAARTFAVQWSVPQPAPFDVELAADSPFHVATVATDTAGMVVIEQTPCGDAPNVWGVQELANMNPFVPPSVASVRCASAFIAGVGQYAINDAAPEGAQTWSVTQPGNALAVPEQRPMPRIGIDGTYAVPINVDRAGRLHVRLSINEGSCFLPRDSLLVFGDDGRRGQRINNCEQVLDVDAGASAGVLVGPPAGGTFSGTIATWWE